MAAPIPPGPLTPNAAAALNAALAAGEGVRRDLDNWQEFPEDEFPAKLTAWDAATQSASWTEQFFDTSGNRVDRVAGRTGSPTFMPAKPVGNGLMPPDAFPVEVRLTRRVVTADKGAVYEFPWTCACAGSGSGTGSGSGNGDILTSCCAGALPRTLTATFTQTAGAACGLDGAAVTLTYSAGTGWTGSTTVGGVTFSVQAVCSGGLFLADFSADSGCSTTTGSGVYTINSCTPLQLTIDNMGVGVGCAACASGTFTITVTE